MLNESLYVLSIMTDTGGIKYTRPEPCPREVYSHLGMKDTKMYHYNLANEDRGIHRKGTEKKKIVSGLCFIL